METLESAGAFEKRISSLNGSGLPEVMKIAGIRFADVDKLMVPGQGSLVDIYQRNIGMYLGQIEAQRSAGLVHPRVIHGLVEALEEINRNSKDRLIFQKEERVNIEGLEQIQTNKLGKLAEIHLKNLIIYQSQLDNPSTKWSDPEALCGVIRSMIEEERKNFEISRQK